MTDHVIEKVVIATQEDHHLSIVESERRIEHLLDLWPVDVPHIAHIGSGI